MTSTLYTEVPGTNCVVDNQHGVLTELHTDVVAHGPSVAFVQLDGIVLCSDDDSPRGVLCTALTGVMLAVDLGARVGERRERHEVRASRVITRDDFDRITGLDKLRLDLGWRE